MPGPKQERAFLRWLKKKSKKTPNWAKTALSDLNSYKNLNLIQL